MVVVVVVVVVVVMGFPMALHVYARACGISACRTAATVWAVPVGVPVGVSPAQHAGVSCGGVSTYMLVTGAQLHKLCRP